MTHPMQHEDALAPHLVPPPPDGAGMQLRYRTGLIVGWGPQDGGWFVRVDGATVAANAVLGGPWVHQVHRGDPVAMLSTVDQRGVATYMVLGHVLPAEQAVEIYGSE